MRKFFAKNLRITKCVVNSLAEIAQLIKDPIDCKIKCRSAGVVILRNARSIFFVGIAPGSHNEGMPPQNYSLAVEEGALLSDPPLEPPLRESVR
jgi:hypothetical protein